MNTIRLAAAAAILFVAAGTRAEAAMPVSPTLPSLAAAPAVEQVTNVCGTNGCAQVQTRRVQKHNIVTKQVGNNTKN